MDLDLSMDMRERIKAVEIDRAEEQRATAELKKAEEMLEEAKKRVEKARVKQQQAAQKSEKNASQVCKTLLDEADGPWNEMYKKLGMCKWKWCVML